MKKIFCASQNTAAKTLPADVCIFGRFGQLSPAAVHSADCWFDSRVKWLIHVSSIVIYLCKTSFLLRWNSRKQCSELSMHCYFWLTVSKCSTHFEHGFLVDKCSCKMVNTLPSVISCNLNLRSAKTSLLIFFFFFFLCFLGQLVNLGDLSVCTTPFKVSVPPLNHCLQRSRLQKIHIKP